MKKPKLDKASMEIEELEEHKASQKSKSSTPGQSPELDLSPKSSKSEPKPTSERRHFLHVSLMIFIPLILTVLITAVYYIIAVQPYNSATVSFSVNDPHQITLSDGDPFNEPGYSAEFCLPTGCQDLTDRIVVQNPNQTDINAGNPGQYDISYTLDFVPAKYNSDYYFWTDTYSFQDQRNITVVDQAPPIITLEGDTEITLYVGDGFSEPGYHAEDAHDGDLTANVSAEGGVDTSAAGTYTITYSVADSSGNQAEPQTRTIYVLDQYHAWYAAQPTQTNNFDELRDYINYNGWDISFGYYNLQNGYQYTYQADKLYYGASLVKTIDAMYAYETGQTDDTHTIRRAITYSQNDAHMALVERFGIQNLRDYAANLGMTHHLQPSQIYGDTYYFCDTTVNDQLAAWKHLWYLINNLGNGWELRDYFINNYWDNLSFDGSPTHMYKNGLYASNYHEAGILFADSPYIVVFLSTEGWRWNSTYIMKDLSNRVFLINDRVANGEI